MSLRPRLIAYARAIQASVEDAEDHVQDLYVRLEDLLAKAPESVTREEDQLFYYLARVLRRRASDRMKRDQRRHELLEAHAPTWHSAGAGGGGRPRRGPPHL